MDKVGDLGSILKPAVTDFRVIPNGVDLATFRPAHKSQIREFLQIPKEAFVLLFVATDAKTNMYKDYTTIHAALEIVSMETLNKKIVFLALGGSDTEECYLGDTLIKSIPYVSDPEEMAKYYQAADVYLHASRAETFGIVIIEAMACGTPVIATDVGGIPELIKNGETGFVVPPADFRAMAIKILYLLEDVEARTKISFAAAEDVKKRFGLDQMINGYLDYYQQVICDWQAQKTTPQLSPLTKL